MKTRVIAAESDVSLRYAAQLRQLIAGALADEMLGVLAIDMRRVTFVDGSGLATLAWACKRMKQKGGLLRLYGVQPHVRGLIEAMHMTAMLNISNDPPLPA